MNKYKRKKCYNPCLTSLCSCCCRSQIDYKKIYEIITKNEMKKKNNKYLFKKQTKLKRRIIEQLDTNNPKEKKKTNILTTYSQNKKINRYNYTKSDILKKMKTIYLGKIK